MSAKCLTSCYLVINQIADTSAAESLRLAAVASDGNERRASHNKREERGHAQAIPTCDLAPLCCLSRRKISSAVGGRTHGHTNRPPSDEGGAVCATVPAILGTSTRIALPLRSSNRPFKKSTPRLVEFRRNAVHCVLGPRVCPQAMVVCRKDRSVF